MNLKEKRKEEIDNQKEKRKDEVIAAALEVFLEEGIENAKMTDIAKKAEIGIASVYRYFKTKPELVIEAASRLWEDEIHLLYSDYNNEGFKKLNGISKIRCIFQVYIRVFKNNKSFIRLIEEFDNYIIKEKISPDRLEGYENTIISLKPLIYDAVEEGKMDGSIREDVDTDLFYCAVTHTFMSLCQKLVLRGRIIKSDNDIDDVSQIKMLIDMTARYIEK